MPWAVPDVSLAGRLHLDPPGRPGRSGSPVPEVQAADGRGFTTENGWPLSHAGAEAIKSFGTSPRGHLQSRTGWKNETHRLRLPAPPRRPCGRTRRNLRETSAQQAGDLQLHARPHGRAQADFLDVAS